jgi:hypothetical protein
MHVFFNKPSLFTFHNSGHNFIHSHIWRRKTLPTHNYLLPMSSDSIASATRATNGSHSPTPAGGVQHQPDHDTTSPPPFDFVTPTRRHEFSGSLESPPRKKHRSNVSSFVDSNRAALGTSTGPTASHLDFHHDDASIVARLDLSTAPDNEFILARPNQVSSSFEIEYPTYMARPRTVSISRDDADTDPIASLQHNRSMEDPTEEGSILTENASNNSPTIRKTRMSGTMVRKVATRTFPWSIATEVNLMLPPLSPPPPPKDEKVPVAKRPRLRTSTAVKKGKWSPKEDALLTEAVKKHGRKWVPVAALVPGRTNPQCRSRWLRHLDPNNGKKGRWTPEEDAILIEAVGKLGKDFTAVADLIPGRTNERCRDRWFRWTPEEDAILTEAVGKLGKDFTSVAALIPGRTSERCRDRWVGCLDFTSSEGLEKGTWTPEEDGKLIEAVQKLGRDWVPVAELVCTRTNTQCRQRWLDDLDRYRGKVRSPRRPWTATAG